MKRSPMPRRRKPLARGQSAELKRTKQLRQGRPLVSEPGHDPAWRSLRRLVAQRADGKCEAGPVLRQAGLWDGCRGWGSSAHHLLRRSQGGKDDLGNLLWVCHGPGSCHGWIHDHPAHSFRLGLLWRKPGPAEESEGNPETGLDE